ncbi:hypothetical protein ACQP3L_36330, partial [Escherichia coli]
PPSLKSSLVSLITLITPFADNPSINLPLSLHRKVSFSWLNWKQMHTSKQTHKPRKKVVFNQYH